MRRRTALFTLLLAASAAGAPAAAAAPKYVVLYKREAAPATVRADVARAGGALVRAYDRIGVAVAQSPSPGFRRALLRDARVAQVAPTAGLAVPPAGAPAAAQPAVVATSDSLQPLQWDMRQTHVPEAHAITRGSPSVVVGDIDTGLDKDHPDLLPNIDFGRSVSCRSGAPDPDPAAWDDDNGHGTHTAGTIAAAANGFGIVGVAPEVRIAGIKASDEQGLYHPEMVICAFMWAAEQRLDVVNNSYFVDPWLFACRHDPVQHAIWKAVQRAIRFAMREGVTVVAAAGNEFDDLSHPGWDVTSPTLPPGSAEERAVTNACAQLPNEVPGVIAVGAVSNARQTDGDRDPDDHLKALYSNYGVDAIDLVAPGGDIVFGRTPEAPNGRVLSTFPAELPCPASVKESEPGPGGASYCYFTGTSMAAPHVAGVAALAISRFGRMRPGGAQALLQRTADPQPCPTVLPDAYLLFTRPAPAGQPGAPQHCQGGPGHTSWYGSGEVDALAAVRG